MKIAKCKDVYECLMEIYNELRECEHVLILFCWKYPKRAKSVVWEAEILMIVKNEDWLNVWPRYGAFRFHLSQKRIKHFQKRVVGGVYDVMYL